MKIYTNEPFFQQFEEMISKKFDHEYFMPCKLVFMPRDLYKQIIKYYSISSGNGIENADLDTVEDGGIFFGASIRVYDIVNGEKDMKKQWLQKASKEMAKKGTVGAFTAQAKKAGGVKKGGGVKDSFIDKELKSKNPTTRKRAQFAKNMKAIAKGK